MGLEQMRAVMIGATAAMAMAGATAAHAERIEIGAQLAYGYVAADCQGDGLRAVVTRSYSTYTLAVYDYGSQIVRQRATRSDADGGGVTITSYKAGSIFDGGANLRIRSEDDEFPQQEGTANLTVRRNGRTVNPILHCWIY